MFGDNKMIYGSILHTQRIIGGAGYLNSGSNFRLNNLNQAISLHVNNQVHKTTSAPTGYQINAIRLPLIEGGLSGRITIFSSGSNNLIGDGYLTGSITIVITTSANGNLLSNITGTTTITISTNGTITAQGLINGTATIGSKPSADDIAQAVWQMQLPGGFSAGSAGELLGSGGGSGGGASWSEPLPGAYTTGQAGKILADLETLTREVKRLIIDRYNINI